MGTGSFVQNLAEFGIGLSLVHLPRQWQLAAAAASRRIRRCRAVSTTGRSTSPAVQPAPTPITPKQVVQLAHDRLAAQTKALREVAQTAVGVTTTAALEAASAVTDVVSGETPYAQGRVGCCRKQVRATVAETVPARSPTSRLQPDTRLVKSVVAAPPLPSPRASSPRRWCEPWRQTSRGREAAVSGEQGAVRTAVTDTPERSPRASATASRQPPTVSRKFDDDVRRRSERASDATSSRDATPAPTAARWMVTIDCGGPWPTPSTRSVGSDRDRDVAARNFLYAPFQCRGPRTHRARLAGDACRGDRSRPRTPCGDDHPRVQLEPAR